MWRRDWRHGICLRFQGHYLAYIRGFSLRNRASGGGAENALEAGGGGGRRRFACRLGVAFRRYAGVAVAPIAAIATIMVLATILATIICPVEAREAVRTPGEHAGVPGPIHGTLQNQRIGIDSCSQWCGCLWDDRQSGGWEFGDGDSAARTELAFAAQDNSAGLADQNIQDFPLCRKATQPKFAAPKIIERQVQMPIILCPETPVFLVISTELNGYNVVTSMVTSRSGLVKYAQSYYKANFSYILRIRTGIVSAFRLALCLPVSVHGLLAFRC
jgi:hypothetical protein